MLGDRQITANFVKYRLIISLNMCFVYIGFEIINNVQDLSVYAVVKAMDLDKDKYLTPAPNLRRTRASHESQYTRYFAYSDALKNSFFPRTIPMWNSLPTSVVSSKTIEEFKAQI